MTLITTPVAPNLAAHTDAKAAEVMSLINQIVAVLNGQLSDDNVKVGADILGSKIKVGTITADRLAGGAAGDQRGKSHIVGVGTRTNGAYGQLDAGAAPGPDQVTGIVMPTDGLILVGFQALWQETAPGTARAAIFLNGNQLMKQSGQGGSPTISEASTTGAAANRYEPLSSNGAGLAPPTVYNNIGSVGDDVSTGQALIADGNGGSFCVIFAAAGTYTVSVRFKGNAGATVTVKNRKLWVAAMGF